MTLVWVIAILLGLLLVLLAIPLQLELRFARVTGKTENEVRLRWGFGLVDIPLRGGAGTQVTESPDRVKPRPRERKPGRLRVRTLLLNPAFWLRVKTLLIRLFRVIQWRAFRFYGRIGLDDPADTGHLWGWLAPLVAVSAAAPLEVRLEPAFEGPELSLQGGGEISFVPLHFLWVLVSFVLTPATWRVLWPAFKRR